MLVETTGPGNKNVFYFVQPAWMFVEIVCVGNTNLIMLVSMDALGSHTVWLHECCSHGQHGCLCKPNVLLTRMLSVITLARISCLWKPNAPVKRMHAVVMLDSINRCYIGTKRAFIGVI